MRFDASVASRTAPSRSCSYISASDKLKCPMASVGSIVSAFRNAAAASGYFSCSSNATPTLFARYARSRVSREGPGAGDGDGDPHDAAQTAKTHSGASNCHERLGEKECTCQLKEKAPSGATALDGAGQVAGFQQP